MGGMGNSTATISNSVTDDPSATPAAKAAARTKLSSQFGLTDTDPPPPPIADHADDLLRRAGATSLLRQDAKKGRQSTFLTESMTDITKLGK